VSSLIDIFLHLDKHLSLYMNEYGVFIYIILFAIVLLRILLNYFLEREIRSSAEFCGPGDFVPPAEE